MSDPQIKDQLHHDLTVAMKERATLRAATIRAALAAISTAEVAGKQAKTLSDKEVTEVLTKELKKRGEAAAAFRAGGREESAQQEEAEAAVLREYLPAPLSPAEVDELVATAVAAAAAKGLSGGRAMGAVMGALKDSTAGRVDGAELAATVKRRLGLG